MKNKFPASTVFFMILVVLLAIALAAVWFVTNSFAIVGFRLYPKDAEFLDVRSDALSVSGYEELSRILPSTEILWNVPFGSSRAASDSHSLIVSSLTDEDIGNLSLFTELESIDAQTCTDYERLAEVSRRYPSLDVDYTISVCGQAVPSDTETITITRLTEADARMLGYLPKLKTVDATGCWDYDLLLSLQANHPEWNVILTDSIGGQKLDPNATHLEASGAGYDELIAGLHYMKSVDTVVLHDPGFDGGTLLKLREDYPNIAFSWDISFNGSHWADSTEEMDLSTMPLGSQTELQAIKDAASKLPGLKKLILEKGSLTDEDIAAFRDEVRSSYRVVWTVVFSPNCSARTDQEWFMPTKVGEYYFNDSMAEKLIYMEDVVSMDLGHHPIHNTDFLKYMPRLEYLDLTLTNVLHITNIEYCTELKFLEIDWNCVRDLGNITECKKLEDLSMCQSYADPAVISQLTWLKNLRWRWAICNQSSMIASLPNTTIYTDYYNPDNLRWRELPNYIRHREIMGMDVLPEY